MVNIVNGMTLFEWKAPGPYRVAFSTRLGGVSEGPFESLNLGVLHRRRRRRTSARTAGGSARSSASSPRRRRWRGRCTAPRSCGPTAAASSRPGSSSSAATASGRTSRGEGMMLLTADCLPVAIVRASGEPAVAALHVGWRGLLAGIVEAGAVALGGGKLAAAIGPGIGACCYEVGDEVAAAFPRAFRRRRGHGRTSRPRGGGRASAPGSGVRDGRAGRPLHVLRGGALLLAPPRPGPNGPPGDRCRSPLASPIRANYERIRKEVGPGVTVVAATKYVSVDELVRPGRGGRRGRRREPPAGPRRQARPLRRDLPLALHRPPAVAQGARRVGALRALPFAVERSRRPVGSRPALVEVNLSGEESKSGVAPAGSPASSWPRRGCSASTSGA